MKKALFAFSATVASVFAAFAQTIPNNDFESWSSDTILLPDYQGYILADTFASNEPTNWTTSNVLTGSPKNFSNKLFVTESNDAYEGSSAIQLTVDTIPVAALGGVHMTIPGFAVSGRFALDFSQLASSSIDLTSLPGAGVPVDGRKGKLAGYYKYTPAVEGQDSAAAVAVLKKGNVIVATAEFYASATTNTYTYFEVPFVYASCEDPDTAIVLLSASNPYLFQSLGSVNVPVGSVVLFDSIAILDTTSTFSIPPVAVADYDTTTAGVAVDISPAANDIECYGNDLTVALTSATSTRGGSLTLNGNVVTYTPTIASGRDTFYYEVSASTGAATGQVVVLVKAAVTGVRNIDNVAVSVYPNPAQNVLNIAVDSKEVAKAVITNVLGQTVAVKEINAEKTAINTSSFENGLYVVTLFNANGKAIYATKFVEAK